MTGIWARITSAGARGGTPVEDQDAGLVMAARDGDAGAFEELVRRHQGQAYRIALRLLSDAEEAREATQDAFIKAYRSLGSFRGEARFRNWFLAVLTNTCRSRRSHLRRRGFWRTEPLEGPPRRDPDDPPREFPDGAESAETTLQRRQAAEQVRAAIARVPEDFREVLVLRDVEGLEYEEIAAALGISVGTVKSRLHRGRAAMKTLLTAAREAEPCA